VPVSFAEISQATALCEIVTMSDDIVPDVSLGTHFFSEIVETEMLYLALFPHHEGNRLDESRLLEAPNQLLHFVPDATPDQQQVIRVISVSETPNRRLILNANTLKQRVVCYCETR
jgi:hypothetical protein